MAGLAFVYVKATQGIYKVNANHDAQVGEARSLGLVVGHYHFPAWGDPAAEAAAFVAGSGWRPGEFMVLDIENSPVTPWPADPVTWSVAFENEVARLLGIWCMDYAGPNVRAMWNWAPLAGLGGGLIDPEYNNVGPSSSAPWANVAMWQNADTNQTGGDSDIFYGDAAALRAYGTPGAVTQSGTITPIKEGFLMALTDAQQQDIYDLIAGAKQVALANVFAAQAADYVWGKKITKQGGGETTPGSEISWLARNFADVPANVLDHSFTLADGTVTNIAGLLDRIHAAAGGTVTDTVTAAPLAALSTEDVAALAKAAADEMDARARRRLTA